MQFDIEKLEDIMALEEHVSFNDTKYLDGVSGIFSFNESLRKIKLGKSGFTPEMTNHDMELDRQDEKENTKYGKSVGLTRHLKNIQNPTSKIQWLAKITNKIKREIDDFWQGIEIDQDDK
mmetsp:Transcript_7406/g.6564  ORF Transcript_7406/g.6564 Transcript_7406/m.6564 type:complete len:120 (-) Transcript_7406:488-847(-)